jgi:hypothetical protein
VPRSRRENFLSVYVLLAVLGLLIVWATGLVLAFAMFHWAAGSRLGGVLSAHGFADDLYISHGLPGPRPTSLPAATPADLAGVPSAGRSLHRARAGARGALRAHARSAARGGAGPDRVRAETR